MRKWPDVIQDLVIWVIMSASTVAAIVVTVKLVQAVLLGHCSLW